MKRSTACGAAALLLCCLVASGVSGRTMAPHEPAPARGLRGIEVAGTSAETRVKPKGLLDWLDALAKEVGQEPVWGNCCGSGVDCEEDSSTIDGLDEACKRHDLCYERMAEINDYPESEGDDADFCDIVCECDGDLARDAAEYAWYDCSQYEDPDYVSACEDIATTADPIQLAMKGRLWWCGC